MISKVFHSGKYAELGLLLSFFAMFSCTPEVQWVTTSESQPWTEKGTIKMTKASGESDIEVKTQEVLQTMEGFGACFNELGWTSLSRLSEQDRELIFAELFEPGKGANFSVCRMPVAANDFSRDWYSYNETDGDFSMSGFSIENDMETLIPFIQEAKKYNPSLKLWASPWSPPTWMKWNKHYACAATGEKTDQRFRNNLGSDMQGKEGTNMFIQKKEYFEAYARYFTRFIEAYRNEGINIGMVMPQNEFNSCQIFPSCTWTASGLAEFIGGYLGPAMEKLDVELFFGTMERPGEALADTILNDPRAGKYIKGVGFQWAGKEAIPGIHKRYPHLALYQTEQECGNGKNDWEYCCYAWSLMKHYLLNGASAYQYWNISLDQGGYSRWGWQQNSLITVDPEKRTYRFNHEYYLLKHVSHFVMPGARLVRTQGNSSDLLAFVNPDKSVVVIIRNEEKSARRITVKIDDRSFQADLDPDSFHTFLIPSLNSHNI